MRHWIRWSYVAPRAGGLLVVLVLLTFVASPVAKWILVAAGQTAIGARVDLGDVQLSFLKGEMRIEAAEFADPGNEFKNLAQFERAELNLDMAALTHKRMVIESGVLEGLQFGGARSKSGELPPAPEQIVNEASRQRTRAWLKQLATLLDEQVVDNLESVKTARDLAEKWPAEYRAWETRADDFERRIDSMEALIRIVRKNPLQHIQEVQKIAVETKGMAEEIASAQAEIGQLKSRVATDKERVKYAALRDRGRVEEALRLTALDGADVAEYFLGDEYAGYAMEALSWASWAKKYLEIAGKPPEVERSQGRNIFFAGLHNHPSFLVKNLALTGVVDVQGNSAKFSGALSNLSSAPKLHDFPTVLQLAIQSENPSNVKMVWDNRTNEPFQELTIATKLSGNDGRTLGDSDSVALSYSAAPGETWFQARFEDGQMKGRLIIKQDGVKLQPLVADKLGGERLRRPLAAGMSSLNHIHIVVDLSGPIRKPNVTFDSNVARELSRGLNEAVQNELAAHKERVLIKAKLAATKELFKLDELLEKKQDALLRRFAAHTQVLRELTGVSNLQQPLTSSLPISEDVREKLKRFDFRSLR